MEVAANQLGENALWLNNHVTVRRCMVCETEMSRGAVEHLPSQRHWKNLWTKLGDTAPTPEQARSWTAQWVEKFETSKGIYLFNHVTGDQGFEHELNGNVTAITSTPPQPLAVPPPKVAPPKPPVASAAPALPAPPTAIEPPLEAALPALLAAIEPPLAVLNAQAAGNVNRSPTAENRQVLTANTVNKFDLPYWIWQRYIEEGAHKLDRALSRESPSGTAISVQCGVCNENTEDVANHLISQPHFQRLQTRMSARESPPRNDELANGPWVQTFQVGQRLVSWNHLTGDVIEPQALLSTLESC